MPVSYSFMISPSRGYWIWVFCRLFSCVYICSSSISSHRCYSNCCLPSTTFHNCLCRGHLILYYPICKFQSLFSFWIACDIPNIEVDTKKQVARHNQPNVYFEVYIHTRQIDNKILTSNTHDNGRNHYLVLNMTGNYNYCNKKYNCCMESYTTTSKNTALIPQQHVIHQVPK